MGWVRYAFGQGAGLALVLSALVRWWPRRGTREDMEISPTVLGFLTGGVRRAVVTALAMLHVEGVVQKARTGMAKRTGDKFTGTDPFLSATYAALYQPNGPRGIADRPQLDRAVAEVRNELIAAWLWVPTGRWVVSRILAVLLVPLIGAQMAATHDALAITMVAVVFVLSGAVHPVDRRTRRARQLVARLRREHTASEIGSDAASIGYAVAAQGKTALLATMPRFAKDSGQLDGGIAARYMGDGSIGPNSYISGAGG